MDYRHMIEHTNLKPDATLDDIKTLCQEAIDCHFYSVCVHPYWVKTCAELLKDTDIKITTVIGFPLGANTTNTKVTEAKEAIENGADEIDMVMNIGAFKQKNYDDVMTDIEKVVKSVRPHAVKVIIETCLLSEEEKIKATQCVLFSGAKYVKTSTGFSKEGAKVSDISLLHKVTKDRIGIKASGGISTRNEMLAMVMAGATRIGTSHSVDLFPKL